MWGRIPGEEFLGNHFWCVKKEGEMLPIFLRIARAMMSGIFCAHSMLIILGEELLGKNSWGRMFGAIGIFVCKTGRNAAHFSQNCWGHDVKTFLCPFDVNNFGGRTFGKEFLGKNFWGHWYLCGWAHDVKICLQPFDVNKLGEGTFGNEFLGMNVGAIGIFVCKTGRNAALFSQNCCGHDVKICLHPFDGIFWGEELLGNKFWGRLFGAIGIFVCKTGRNAARFSQNGCGNFGDVNNFLRPFDVNHLGGRIWGKMFGEEFLGPLVSLCVKQGEMLPVFLIIVGATSVISRIVCTRSMLIIWGEELLGKNFWGIIFGGHWYLCV